MVSYCPSSIVPGSAVTILSSSLALLSTYKDTRSPLKGYRRVSDKSALGPLEGSSDNDSTRYDDTSVASLIFKVA